LERLSVGNNLANKDINESVEVFKKPTKASKSEID